jgi:hypothetical protein
MKEKLGDLAIRCTKLADERYEFARRVESRIRKDFELADKTSERLSSWWLLEFKALRAILKKDFKVEIPVSERDDWETALSSWKNEFKQRSGELVVLEEEINGVVEAAFRLSNAEVNLLMRHMQDASINYELGSI